MVGPYLHNHSTMIPHNLMIPLRNNENRKTIAGFLACVYIHTKIFADVGATRMNNQKNNEDSCSHGNEPNHNEGWHFGGHARMLYPISYP